MTSSLPASIVALGRTPHGSGPFYTVTIEWRRAGSISYSQEALTGHSPWLVGVSDLATGAGLDSGQLALPTEFGVLLRGADTDGAHCEEQLRSESPVNCACAVSCYYTPGLPDPSEAVVIRRGIIRGGARKLTTGIWELRVSPIEADWLAQPIPARVVTLEEFPRAPDDALGRALPVVIGDVDYLPGLLLDVGQETRLAARMRQADNTALVADASQFRVKDYASTTLAVPIDSYATEITVTDGTEFPTAAFFVAVDVEGVWVAERSGNVLSGCIRGLHVSTPTSHVAGEGVTQYGLARIGDEIVAYTSVSIDLYAGGWRLLDVFRAQLSTEARDHAEGTPVEDWQAPATWLLADHESRWVDPDRLMVYDAERGLVQATSAFAYLEADEADTDFVTGRTTTTVTLPHRLRKVLALPHAVSSAGYSLTEVLFESATTPDDAEGCWSNPGNAIDAPGGTPDISTYASMDERPTAYHNVVGRYSFELTYPTGTSGPAYSGLPSYWFDATNYDLSGDPDGEWTNAANAVDGDTDTYATCVRGSGGIPGILKIWTTQTAPTYIFGRVVSNRVRVKLQLVSGSGCTVSVTQNLIGSQHIINAPQSSPQTIDFYIPSSPWSSQAEIEQQVSIRLLGAEPGTTVRVYEADLHAIYDPLTATPPHLRCLQLQRTTDVPSALLGNVLIALLEVRSQVWLPGGTYLDEPPQIWWASETASGTGLTYVGWDEVEEINVYQAQLPGPWDTQADFKQSLYLYGGSGSAVNPLKINDARMVFLTGVMLWTDPDHAIDGDESTYATYQQDAALSTAYLGLSLAALPDPGSPIKRVKIGIVHGGSGPLDQFRVRIATGPLDPGPWVSVTASGDTTTTYVDITDYSPDAVPWDWTTSFQYRAIWIHLHSSVSGGSYRIYEAWAEVQYWDDDLDPRAITVVARAQGLIDDALGTYTGTAGALIENPADALAKLLVWIGGASLSRVRWTQARDDRASWQIATLLARQETLGSLVARLQDQFFLRLLPEASDGNLVVRSLPSADAEPDHYLGPGNVVTMPPVEQTPERWLVNVPTGQYRIRFLDSDGRLVTPFRFGPSYRGYQIAQVKDPWVYEWPAKKQVDGSAEELALDSIDRYGAEYPATIALDLIRAPATARLWLAEWLRWRGFLRWQLRGLEVGPMSDAIQVYDVVELGHGLLPRAPGARDVWMRYGDDDPGGQLWGPLPGASLRFIVTGVRRVGRQTFLDLISMEACP